MGTPGVMRHIIKKDYNIFWVSLSTTKKDRIVREIKYFNKSFINTLF